MEEWDEMDTKRDLHAGISGAGSESAW